MVLAKSRLVSVENVVLREIIHSLVVYFFSYNFGDWPKIFRICLSTFFIQRFQLCCFGMVNISALFYKRFEIHLVRIVLKK